MDVKIFISWSGTTSKQLASALRDWIPGVIQRTQVYFTATDIEKGARWSTDIASELKTCHVGIFCMTRDNLESKWMMFEAGAISKSIESTYVCPILFDLEPADISGPLVQFQLSRFEKEDMLKLMRTINNAACEHKLQDTILDNVFEKFWNDLDVGVSKILQSKDSDVKKIRSDRELLEEMLAAVRLLNEKPSIIDSIDDAYRNKIATILYKIGMEVRAHQATVVGLSNVLKLEKIETQIAEISERLSSSGYQVENNIFALVHDLEDLLLRRGI